MISLGVDYWFDIVAVGDFSVGFCARPHTAKQCGGKKHHKHTNHQLGFSLSSRFFRSSRYLLDYFQLNSEVDEPSFSFLYIITAKITSHAA